MSKHKHKKETEIKEFIDIDGVLKTSKRQGDLSTKGITQRGTTDQYVKTMAGGSSLDTFGNIRKTNYWNENDLTTSLGFNDTIDKDLTYSQAKEVFIKKLGLSEEDAIKRLEQMGYDSKLPDSKLRLVENVKQYISDYVETLLTKKSKDYDIVKKSTPLDTNIKIKLKVIKNMASEQGYSMRDIIGYLKS